MSGSTDWRFDNVKWLEGQAFRLEKYRAPSLEWDHDHCEGCMAKFAEFEGSDILHEGYVHASPYTDGPEPEFITHCKEQGMRCIMAPGVEGKELHWLCPQCFDDFQELLGFGLEP